MGATTRCAAWWSLLLLSSLMGLPPVVAVCAEPNDKNPSPTEIFEEYVRLAKTWPQELPNATFDDLKAKAREISSKFWRTKDASVKYLLQVAEHDTELLRRILAIEILSDWGIEREEFFQVLLKTLSAKEARLRSDAIDALVSINREWIMRAKPQLVKLIHDPDVNVQQKALAALQQAKEADEIVPILVAYIQDPKTIVRNRRWAMDCLAAVAKGENAGQAIRLLRELLHDEDVSIKAASALAEMGPLGVSALDDIIALRHDPDTAKGSHFRLDLAIEALQAEKKKATRN